MKTILAAIDYSDSTTDVLKTAADLTEAYKGSLTSLHVDDAASVIYDPPTVNEDGLAAPAHQDPLLNRFPSAWKGGDRMVILILQWVSLICLVAALGIVLTLLMKEPPDTQPGSTFVRIHHYLVHRYGPAMGIAETGAFITTLILTILFEGHWMLFFLSALAWVCITSMIVIWALRIYPINKRVDLWEVEAIPEDWPTVRSRWHRLHAERVAFGFIGIIALIVTVSIS